MIDCRVSVLVPDEGRPRLTEALHYDFDPNLRAGDLVTMQYNPAHETTVHFPAIVESVAKTLKPGGVLEIFVGVSPLNAQVAHDLHASYKSA